jgi:hypothetical protein
MTAIPGKLTTKLEKELVMKVKLNRILVLWATMLVLPLLMLDGTAQAEEVSEAVVSETAIAVDVIVNIDTDSRTITLKDELSGEKWEYIAGAEVENFDQLKRGDLVIMEYYTGLAIALEPKGSGLEERVTESELDRAQPGEKPGMQYTESTYIEAVVTAVSPEQGSITFEGPEASLTMMVADDVDLSAIETGQVLEVLYIESYAISVEAAPKVSGTIEMKISSVALGIGVEWGKGTLTMYDDTTHEFKINGFSVLDAGASVAHATGDVYHLVEAADLEGTFISGEAGAVLVGGGAALAMKNSAGVVVSLKSKQKGARLTLAVEGFKIKLK